MKNEIYKTLVNLLLKESKFNILNIGDDYLQTYRKRTNIMNQLNMGFNYLKIPVAYFTAGKFSFGFCPELEIGTFYKNDHWQQIIKRFQSLVTFVRWHRWIRKSGTYKPTLTKNARPGTIVFIDDIIEIGYTEEYLNPPFCEVLDDFEF